MKQELTKQEEDFILESGLERDEVERELFEEYNKIQQDELYIETEFEELGETDLSPEQEEYMIESGIERWRGLDDDDCI